MNWVVFVGGSFEHALVWVGLMVECLVFVLVGMKWMLIEGDDLLCIVELVMND